MTTDTVEEDFNRNRNISPADYVITEKDYMRKDCKTILNSEVAALKVAEEIYQVCHVENKKFFDMEFGPTIEDAESDQYFEESAKSLYFNGQTPRGYTNPRQIIWKYPIDYLREGAEDESGKKLSVSIKPKFVIDDASSNEVKQGAIGDCWFIGAMSVVATKDELIRGGGGFINIDVNTKVDADTSQMLSKGVYPPIFHKFRKHGIYVIRFFKNFKWRYVIIDERIPVHLASKLPVFASCVKQEELWVPLIEKAYAKLFGCYETLVSGFIDDGVVDMTGFVCEKKTLSDKDGMFTEDPDKFWEFMHESKENGSLMGCSVAGGGVESKVIIDGVNCGVLSGHAYALNDIIELKGKEGKRNIHRLLRIRNPWGRGEWNGKWSDESEEIQNNMAKIEAYRNELELEEQFEIGAEDGTFLINYKEWRNIYNRLFVANDFECEWNAIRFESEWKMETSGGCPL